MQSDHTGESASKGQAPTPPSGKANAMDFAYLASQTFGDADLERDLLTLFVAQARRLVPDLPSRETRDQVDATHLLKGSARAIGALRVATAAEAYERAEPSARTAVGVHFLDLMDALSETERAIASYLAAFRSTPASP